MDKALQPSPAAVRSLRKESRRTLSVRFWKLKGERNIIPFCFKERLPLTIKPEAIS